jgi:soluble lytic murein transglycosylase-like protein
VEDIPLRETRYYVKKVLKSYYGYKRTYSGG